MPRPARVPFKSQVREYRLQRGLTQEQLAHLIGITPEMVRKHERGESFPIPLYRERYSELFNASEADLWVRSIAPTAGARGRTSAPVSLATPLNIDDLLLARAEIPRIVALDNRFGAADIVNVAVRLFMSLQNRQPSSPSIRRDVYATLAEVAEVAGWLAYDAEKHPLARRMNQESLHYARLSGDRSTELLALQNMSMHAAALGRPDESLALVEPVLHDEKLSPRLRALFMTREARALAQLGEGSALKKFGPIRSLFLDGVTDADLHHFWWVDERELAWHEAMAARDLGRSTHGVDFFERSVEATPASETRSQYLHRAYLLRAQAEQQAWSDAECTAASLRPLAVEVASTRTDQLLQKLSNSGVLASAPTSAADTIGELVLLTENKLLDEGTLS